MTHVEIEQCLAVGLDAVREAGDIALRYFRKPMDVKDKRPGVFYDPVTKADTEIETLIRERIGQRFPDHRIVGEEHGDTGGGDTYWIIDPIDGTRAFISGMPCWGILLGLVVDGKPAAGIMHQPFTGETFAAHHGGAWLDHLSERTPLQCRADAALADAVLYSTHHTMFIDPEFARRYEELSTRCRLHRWGGDCYSYCLLALGTVDLVVESMLQPYDIIPLIPIIVRAGGVVTDLYGDVPMLGGTVVASANAALHRQTLDILVAE